MPDTSGNSIIEHAWILSQTRMSRRKRRTVGIVRIRSCPPFAKHQMAEQPNDLAVVIAILFENRIDRGYRLECENPYARFTLNCANTKDADVGSDIENDSIV